MIKFRLEVIKLNESVKYFIEYGIIVSNNHPQKILYYMHKN